MKFDVIIGNPPYQLNDGGGVGTSAMPIYHKFIKQAKKLNPKYMTMIVPSRWLIGGRGLDDFRDEMLNDDRIRIIHDFINASDCFPNVEIKGGVTYFLWNRDNKGLCHIYTHSTNDSLKESIRPLLENGLTTFIRRNEAISILEKVQSFNEESFANMVSANDPFGFDVRVENSYKRIKPKFSIGNNNNFVEFYYNGWRTKGLGYIDKSNVSKNSDWIDKYKILIPKAWGIGDMQQDWITPFVVQPNSCCTETYLVVGPFNDNELIDDICNYMQTKFFHLLVSILKITQNTMKKVYQLVPMQDFTESWTDEKLYKKYRLNQEEIDFIESMIRPME